MADETSQRALFDLFRQRFLSSQSFTRQEMMEVTGWSDTTYSTYRSKMFGELLVSTGGESYKLKEAFQRFMRWEDFRRLVAQKRSDVEFAKYTRTDFHAPVVFEFFLPFAHELTLRAALDSLFYRDTVLRRLQSGNLNEFRMVRLSALSDAEYISELVELVGEKFGGYSIMSASGRFRASALQTRQDAYEAQRSGDPYLIDETTAVVRFICPILSVSEVPLLRLLFERLFVQAVLEVMVSEAEVWVLESGAESQLHIWRRIES